MEQQDGSDSYLRQEVNTSVICVGRQQIVPYTYLVQRHIEHQRGQVSWCSRAQLRYAVGQANLSSIRRELDRYLIEIGLEPPEACSKAAV